jgi:ABC-type nitrate/sulfonate/bicarbonate transport system substrate-binding protein
MVELLINQGGRLRGNVVDCSPSRCLVTAVRLLVFVFIQAMVATVALAGQPLVLALAKTPLSLPFYVAEHEGYFVAEGVTVETKEVIGGVRAMQLLLDGQADLSTASETVVMFTAFKRDDFAVIASFVRSTDDVKVISLGESISKPEQLEGKRIGTVLGSAAEYYLNTLVLLSGKDPRSMSVMDVQPEAMAAALQQQKVDAVAIWQPYAYRIEHDVSGAKTLPDSNFFLLRFNLIIPRRIAGVRDNDLEKLLRALDHAQRFIAAEPAKAQAILRARLQLDQPYVDWLWTRYRYQLTLDQGLLRSLEGEARWARDEGHVSDNRPPNFQTFIYARPLRSVRPSAVGIAD